MSKTINGYSATLSIGGQVTNMHEFKIQLKKVWQFPYDKFVQYEESDEKWARPLGFGYEVVGTSREYIKL